MTLDPLVAEAPALPPIPVEADWSSAVSTSQTTLTTHLWAAPPLRRGTPIHDQVFAALRDLKADHVRFLPWFSHPKLSVPELEPPTSTRTFWDFQYLDPIVEDFMTAAEGRPVVANFATIPSWMFTTPEPVAYDADPDTIHWDYEQGTQLRDPDMTEVAEYFYRLASWYIAGGFTDELGVWHESGHRYRFSHWEVLCEPDLGHQISPEIYTRLYDAVVRKLSPLDPDMKFVGLSLSHMHHNPEYFWHFLDSANHEPGVRLDAVSYHFYASPNIVNPFQELGNAPYEEWRATFFAQADGFVDQVALLESIKQRLAPQVETFLNEVGTYAPDIMNPDPKIPDEYWALSASVVSYMWSRFTAMGISLVGVAEFMDYPGMIPGASLLDWDTGLPNARYRAMQLLMDSFGPGDTLVSTSAGMFGGPDPRIHAQGFSTVGGARRILLVNKSAVPMPVQVAGAGDAAGLSFVDTTTGAGPATTTSVANGQLTLGPYATVVLTFPAS